MRTAPTGVDDGHLEVGLRFAKRAPEDIVIRIAVTNRGLRPAVADLLTQFGSSDARWEGDGRGAPAIRAVSRVPIGGMSDDIRLLSAHHSDVGTWWLTADTCPGADHRGGRHGRLVPVRGCHWTRAQTRTLRLRLNRGDVPKPPVGPDAEATLGTRARESSAFQTALLSPAGKTSRRSKAVKVAAHAAHTVRSTRAEHAATGAALARLIWQPRAADASVVDEVFAALGLAVADPVAAQRRLASVIDQRLRGPGASTEPPVAAWAALRIHELLVSRMGRRDHDALERVFQALLDDYSRWVDRIDPADRNPLQGGLLGLDGTGSTAAGAAWMGCYSVWMLSLAVELARDDQTYQDVAVTLLDTTLAMIRALDDLGGSGIGMWDENDGWYHDVVRANDGDVARVAGRSAIGLVPLLAVAIIPGEALQRLPEVSGPARLVAAPRCGPGGVGGPRTPGTRDPRRHAGRPGACIPPCSGAQPAGPRPAWRSPRRWRACCSTPWTGCGCSVARIRGRRRTSGRRC